jgi:signal transduction histidine kinase
VTESARSCAPERVQVEITAPDDLPTLPADPDRLGQVLANLVENAIKYSPDGGTVAGEHRGHGRPCALRRPGRGARHSRREHERIFTKFYRLDPNLTRGVGGTGLGLYICRELVRRMEGRIWVVSRPGGGSTSFLDLPVGRAPVLGEPDGRPAQPAPAG